MSERPPFETVHEYWLALLTREALSTNLRWVFRENLCLTGVRDDGSFTIAFQTEIDPVTEETVRSVYERLSPEPWPVVLDALVQASSFTLCTILGDEYEAEDEHYREDWDLYFSWTAPYTVYEEVRDRGAWRKLKARESAVPSGLDYVISLERMGPKK